MNKGLLIGVGVLVGVAVIAYLLTGMGPTTQRVSPSPQAVASTAPATESAEGKMEKTVVVSGSEYSFSPKSIEVTAGEPVKLTFKNTGNLPHDLTITELGVKTNVVAGGKEDTVTFTPEKSGSFTFYCSVGNHRQLGMEGTATVK